MELIDYLSRQADAPGALAGFLQALAVIATLLTVVRLWRADRQRERRTTAREAEALADIADYACDLVIHVSDALRDEVNAQDFVEGFDRRLLIDADLMLESVPTGSLPSLTLLRPLFELRWAVERSLEIADWLAEAIEDPDRTGWREVATEMSGLTERTAIAAEAFRTVAGVRRAR